MSGYVLLWEELLNHGESPHEIYRAVRAACRLVQEQELSLPPGKLKLARQLERDLRKFYAVVGEHRLEMSLPISVAKKFLAAVKADLLNPAPSLEPDVYEEAYDKANRWLANKDDHNLQELLSKLSADDRGTLRDRLADAFVAGLQGRRGLDKTLEGAILNVGVNFFLESRS